MSTAPFTLATPGTPCGWRDIADALTCQGGHPGPAEAVHVLTRGLPVAPAGTPLCAGHSPYDYAPERGEVTEIEYWVPVGGNALQEMSPGELVELFSQGIRPDVQILPRPSWATPRPLCLG